MCYRYQLALSPKLEPIAEAAKRSKLYYNNIGWLGKPVLTEGEIFPASIVPVLASSKGGRKTAYPMWWGYKVQGLGRPLVNARSETAAEKEIFRESWVGHRCAVPASWYYEWEHLTGNSGQKITGRKFMIQPKNVQAVWLAGLYRIEEGLPVFTILTRDAEGELRRIHDRMPVILPKALVAEWVRPDAAPEHIVSKALTEAVAEACP